jgi:undecaprenyl-diphosphatase
LTILQSILLGIIQGLTEFLPISSSAHLVLVPYLLNWQIPEKAAFVYNVLVQDATLLAVFIYYWNDVREIVVAVIQGILIREPFHNEAARLGWLIVVATIPAGVIGLAFKDAVEASFGSPIGTAVSLLITAALLVIAERISRQSKKLEQTTWWDAVVVGFFQAAAILPGISRSGATITGGMARGLERPAAARFSFLMSMPIMLAAGLLASLDLIGMPDMGSLLPVFLPGFLAAAIVGYLSIRWLLRFLVHHSMYIFSIYCALVGLIVILFSMVK